MNNQNLRDICGTVVLPLATAAFFILGWIFSKQGLLITGCVSLCASLTVQFIIMRD